MSSNNQAGADLSAEVERLTAELKQLTHENAVRAAAMKERELQTAKRELDAALATALSTTAAVPKIRAALVKASRDYFTFDPNEGRFIGPDGADAAAFIAAQARGEWDHLLTVTPGSSAPAERRIEIESIKPGANNEPARAEIAKLAKEMLNR